MTQTSSKDTVA